MYDKTKIKGFKFKNKITKKELLKMMVATNHNNYLKIGLNNDEQNMLLNVENQNEIIFN